MLPTLLPGGRVLLYTVRRRVWSWGDEEVVAQDLATGKRTALVADATDARYVDSGHIVFLRRGTLFAVPFDPDRLLVHGAPVAVVEHVAQALTGGASAGVSGAGQFAVSRMGAIAWVSGDLVPYPPRALVRIDRQGRLSPLPGAPQRGYGAGVRVSPRGDELAVSMATSDDVSVWTLHLTRGTFSRVTRAAEADAPIWSRDGRHLVFSWLKDGRAVIARQDVEGAAPPEVLTPAKLEGFSSPYLQNSYPSSWTPDGRELLFVVPAGAAPMVATVENGRTTVRPFPGADSSWKWPEFSPDGRWLVYGIAEADGSDVYVQPYPGARGRVRVSIQGGGSPAWGKNGREIFFVSPADETGKRRMMAADFDPKSGRAGVPRPLFDIDPTLVFWWRPLRAYDVAPDGQHFYVRQDLPIAPLPPVTHVNLRLDWFEELKAKVPRSR